MQESVKDWTIILGYAAFMLSILFIMAVCVLAVDIGPILDANGNGVW